MKNLAKLTDLKEVNLNKMKQISICGTIYDIEKKRNSKHSKNCYLLTTEISVLNIIKTDEYVFLNSVGMFI